MSAQQYFYDFCEPRGTRNWVDTLRPELDPLLRQSKDHNSNVLDLLDLSVAAYAADRLSKRGLGFRYDPENLVQGRTIFLRVPVRNPESWSRIYKHRLQSLLAELTFDTWDFEFVLRQASDPVQPPLVNEPITQPYVALFSGGLDSVAGALIELGRRDAGTALLVHGSTNGRQRSMQFDALSTIQKRFAQARPVRFSYSLDRLSGKRVPEGKQEKSQRVRGLVYLTLGAVTAALTAAEEILVFENGVGAINLPYTSANTGSDHSRSVHPTVLVGMQELLDLCLESRVKIRNPFMWSTKGQMVAQVNRMGHGDLALMSVSCDGFPLRTPHRQCGCCTSCLLRRASLLAGGSHSEDRNILGEYLFDIFEANLFDSDARLLPLRSMFTQVDRIRKATNSTSPIRSIFYEFTELHESLNSLSQLYGLEEADAAAQLVKLFRAYVQEMEFFAQFVPYWALQDKAIA